jgi:hypothetical protein
MKGKQAIIIVKTTCVVLKLVNFWSARMELEYSILCCSYVGECLQRHDVEFSGRETYWALRSQDHHLQQFLDPC